MKRLRPGQALKKKKLLKVRSEQDASEYSFKLLFFLLFSLACSPMFPFCAGSPPFIPFSPDLPFFPCSPLQARPCQCITSLARLRARTRPEHEGSYGNLSSCSAVDGTRLTEASDSSGSGSDSEDSSEEGSGQRRSFLDSLILNPGKKPGPCPKKKKKKERTFSFFLSAYFAFCCGRGSSEGPAGRSYSKKKKKKNRHAIGGQAGA